MKIRRENMENMEDKYWKYRKTRRAKKKAIRRAFSFTRKESGVSGKRKNSRTEIKQICTAAMQFIFSMPEALRLLQIRRSWQAA